MLCTCATVGATSPCAALHATRARSALGVTRPRRASSRVGPSRPSSPNSEIGEVQGLGGVASEERASGVCVCVSEMGGPAFHDLYRTGAGGGGQEAGAKRPLPTPILAPPPSSLDLTWDPAHQLRRVTLRRLRRRSSESMAGMVFSPQCLAWVPTRVVQSAWRDAMDFIRGFPWRPQSDLWTRPNRPTWGWGQVRRQTRLACLLTPGSWPLPRVLKAAHFI